MVDDLEDRLTEARASNLDNLDAKSSEIKSKTDLIGDANPTAAGTDSLFKFQKRLDDKVGVAGASPFDTLFNALVELGNRLTTARASNLDNLDATISSRASQASVDTLLQFTTVSQTFSATAGTVTEEKTIRLTSTQFPVVIYSIYVEASLGTGTAAVSGDENIQFDKFAVNGVTVIDPVDVVLIIGSDTAGSDRALLSEESVANLENTFPLGIDGDFELGLVLNSVAVISANNGFNFKVIAIVEAPANANVTIHP